jgi:hypothetical protein
MITHTLLYNEWHSALDITMTGWSDITFFTEKIRHSDKALILTGAVIAIYAETKERSWGPTLTTPAFSYYPPLTMYFPVFLSGYQAIIFREMLRLKMWQTLLYWRHRKKIYGSTTSTFLWRCHIPPTVYFTIFRLWLYRLSTHMNLTVMHDNLH